MMEWIVTSSSITEPVDKSDVKDLLGISQSNTAFDDQLDAMIVAAREWFEKRTALSVVSKDYKVRFEQEDCEDEWYELPFSPVNASPAITVNTTGITTTFQQKGLKRVYIRPDDVVSTIVPGMPNEEYYVEATFTAGEDNNSANECIKSIVVAMFTNKSTAVNVAYLPYTTIKLIDSLSVNL